MARMICPACRHRPEHVVNDACTFCGGIGTVVLGPPALDQFSPEVVSGAVAIVVESQLRQRATRLGRATLEHLATVREYVAATGLIALGADDGRPRRHRPGTDDRRLSEALAAEVSDNIRPWDSRATAADVPLFEYGEDDRPLAGGLPVLSAEGHPSHTARTVDPADALGSTRQNVIKRRRRQREQTVLARAAVMQYREGK